MRTRACGRPALPAYPAGALSPCAGLRGRPPHHPMARAGAHRSRLTGRVMASPSARKTRRTRTPRRPTCNVTQTPSHMFFFGSPSKSETIRESHPTSIKSASISSSGFARNLPPVKPTINGEVLFAISTLREEPTLLTFSAEKYTSHKTYICSSCSHL